MTHENINDLLGEVTPEGGDIGLLSIDVDSIDYWIWDAGDGFQPRVVVCEHNASFGRKRSETVPPRDGLDRHAKHASGYYHRATLASLHKLAAAPDYHLVGCDSAGVKASFVRRDCANGLPNLDPSKAYLATAWRANPADPEEKFHLIQYLPLTEV